MSSRRARCECQGMVAVGGSRTVLAAMCQEIWFYSTRIRRAGSAMIVEAAKGGHREAPTSCSSVVVLCAAPFIRHPDL